MSENKEWRTAWLQLQANRCTSLDLSLQLQANRCTSLSLSLQLQADRCTSLDLSLQLQADRCTSLGLSLQLQADLWHWYGPVSAATGPTSALTQPTSSASLTEGVVRAALAGSLIFLQPESVGTRSWLACCCTRSLPSELKTSSTPRTSTGSNDNLSGAFSAGTIELDTKPPGCVAACVALLLACCALNSTSLAPCRPFDCNTSTLASAAAARSSACNNLTCSSFILAIGVEGLFRFLKPSISRWRSGLTIYRKYSWVRLGNGDCAGTVQCTLHSHQTVPI